MQLQHVTSPNDIAAVRYLFQEYAAALGVDLCFQNFAEELATLPGSYAPPRGRLIIGRENDSHLSVGCVALRSITDSVCEMKRLYVRPEFRGRGAGKQLAESIIAEAKHIGYTTMRLDTLTHMLAATRLYESLGFVRRNAYYVTPLHGTIFMELAL